MRKPLLKLSPYDEYEVMGDAWGHLLQTFGLSITQDDADSLAMYTLMILEILCRSRRYPRPIQHQRRTVKPSVRTAVKA